MLSRSRNLGGTTGIQTHTRPFVDGYVFFYLPKSTINFGAKAVTPREIARCSRLQARAVPQESVRRSEKNGAKNRKGEVVCQIKK